VNRLLLAWLAVIWLAVVARIDHFPLTWAPMYSNYKPRAVTRVNLVDEVRMADGLFATRANGEVFRLGRDDLNLPKWNFWRIYYQRMRGRGPIKHKQGNASLSALNRAWRGLEPGEPNFVADWPCRTIRSVNVTLGLEPGDPAFIVRLEARYHRRTVDRSNPTEGTDEEIRDVVEWNEDWRARWGTSGAGCI
jgi:hypothetical protein